MQTPYPKYLIDQAGKVYTNSLSYLNYTNIELRRQIEEQTRQMIISDLSNRIARLQIEQQTMNISSNLNSMIDNQIRNCCCNTMNQRNARNEYKSREENILKISTERIFAKFILPSGDSVNLKPQLNFIFVKDLKANCWLQKRKDNNLLAKEFYYDYLEKILYLPKLNSNYKIIWKPKRYFYEIDYIQFEVLNEEIKNLSVEPLIEKGIGFGVYTVSGFVRTPCRINKFDKQELENKTLNKNLSSKEPEKTTLEVVCELEKKLFPENPIRDWSEKEYARIEEKYAYVKDLPEPKFDCSMEDFKTENIEIEKEGGFLSALIWKIVDFLSWIGSKI